MSDKLYAIVLDLWHESIFDFKHLSQVTRDAFYNRLYHKG